MSTRKEAVFKQKKNRGKTGVQKKGTGQRRKGKKHGGGNQKGKKMREFRHRDLLGRKNKNTERIPRNDHTGERKKEGG